MTSIVEVIQHYQRSIDSSQENEARLLHCINKLYKLPIKVEHLQETGIGKTVNSLRKFNGEIGVAAKTLVTKWKAMVAAEEEPMETSSQTNQNETHNDTNGDGSGTAALEQEDDENHNPTTTIQKSEDSKHCKSKDDDDKHKQKHGTHSSSSSNSHKDNSKHSISTSLDRHSEEKASKNSTEKHKSSSRDKSKSSGSSEKKDKEREKEKEKKEHKSSRDRHKERDHSKEKERHDKNRDEKSKSDRGKADDSRNSSHSPQQKSSSHTSSSKSKHEDKHGHSSSAKDKERSNKHKSASRDKERSKEENLSVHSSSSSKEGPKPSSMSSSSKSATKEQNTAERKRRHNSDNESNEFKSPQPKVGKVHKSASPSMAAEEEGTDESFDSSMGANFDDVLGMLNMPVKRGKKSLKSPSTPLNNCNSAIKKDTNSQRQTASSSSSIIPNKINDTRLTSTPNSSSSYSTPASLKTVKPDLLAPTAKLEPLDPSIVFELPTISTNYKPMPLNQTVMDCVFNNSSSTSKPVRTLSDAEAISHGISSKTMRTKIYSGVRTGQTFQVPTLFDMCIRLLQKNIDALEYTGGVPFEVLKPVLERASPQQLYVFEEYNPYLMEDSDILWQQHVSRTYRTKKRIENESWREMFIRCQEEEERKLSVLKDSIKASQKIAAAPVRKTQLAFVDSMVKPPRNVLRKQEQFGTKAKLVATPAARVAALSSVTPNAAKMGDQRLKVSTAVRDHAQVSSSAIRPKKAPLMQKTLQFIRGRHKR